MEQGFSVSDNDSAEPGQKIIALLSRSWFQLLLVFLAILATYFHTLDVPFYLDDLSSIRNNPAVRDIGNLAGLWSFSGARIVGYFTFALNYTIHDYQLAGYHIANILIHFGAAITVYFLGRIIIGTRSVAPYCTETTRKYLPLLIALLFALHPLQTQAVTYIVQRSASLAALFYLLSLVCYLKARLTLVPTNKILLFGLSCVFAILALFTKQNTITLFIAIFLLEICFLKPDRKSIAVVFMGLLLAGIGVVSYFSFGLNQSFIEFLSNNTLETTTVTRAEYFTIQMQVLWSYIGKFFLPISLTLDYDIAVVESFFNLKTMLFSVGHLALITGSILLIRRSRVIAFSILFYYAAHLVESSIIPIRDFAFEHRSYLPNFGLCLLVSWGLLNLLPKLLGNQKLLFACPVLLVFVLGGVTWNRNNLWRDPIVFFNHEVEVNPDNFRSYSMLAENYSRLKDYPNALAAYQNAAPLYASLVSKDTNTEVAFYSNYILALDETGNYDQALAVIDTMALESLQPQVQSLFLTRRGIIYAKTSQFALAEKDFLASISLDSLNLDAKTNYALLLLGTNRLQQSRELYQEVYDYDPNNPEAIRGLEYFRNNPVP